MKILGLDPSLTRTGWGVITVTDNRFIYKACGTIPTKPSDALENRLVKIVDTIRSVVATHKPDALAIESLFINSNKNYRFAGMNLAMLRGALLYFMTIENIKFYSYMPKAVKKEVTKDGSANKELVLSSLMNYISIPKEARLTHDKTDAIAVALCHVLKTINPQ